MIKPFEIRGTERGRENIYVWRNKIIRKKRECVCLLKRDEQNGQFWRICRFISQR